MSLNQIQQGEKLDVSLGAVTKSGDVVVMTDMVGIAQTSGKIGDVIAVATEGVFLLPKTAGTAYAQGKRLYWDATAKATTDGATGNVKIGYAAAPAASGDTTARVTLIPS